MTKEETLDMIIDDYKNGSQSAMTDYCNGTRCDDCLFESGDCVDEVNNMLIDRLLKAEEKKETNLEHYIVRSGVHITKEHDIEVWEFRFKRGTEKQFFDSDCASICDWLLAPYEEPKPKYKITQFEYDLLKSYGEETRSIDIFCYFSLDMMRKKGYFKGIQGTATFGDVLDNCEVIKMRLIDADALIQDMIEKGIPFNADVNEAILNAREIGGYADYVDRVWEIAYERGKEEALQWIPCSERLPDKDGDYLITYDESYANDYDYDRLVSIAPFEVASEAFGYWYQRLGTNGWVGEDWISIPVVAWMPLPEPYRGDDNE